MKFHFPDKTLLVLIVTLLLLRMLATGVLNLGNDEVYYWVYSLDLKWSYFDHPPMVGWAIFLTSIGDLLHSEFFIRLTALMSWVVSAILLFSIACSRFGETAGVFVVSLLSLSIYNSIIAGVMILPDSPLILFASIFLFAFHRVEKDDSDIRWWLLLGISLGLAYWSKYQSFLWAPMLVAWAFFFSRRWFVNVKFYLASVVNLILLLPVLYFNFLTSVEQAGYHGSRFGFDSFRPTGLLQAAVGEMLYMHPVVFVLLIIAAMRKSKFTETQWFYLMASLPIIAAGWSIALFEATLPHWTGPAYLFLFLFIISRIEFVRYRSWLKWSLIVQIFLIVVALGEVSNGWFSNLQAKGKNPYELGRLDGTLDIYGWDQLRDGLQSYDIERLVINHWYPGSHEYFYISEALGCELIPYGEADMLHELIHHPSHTVSSVSLPAHYIESSRYPRQGRGIFEDRYDLNEIGRIPVVRSGDTVMMFFVNEVVECAYFKEK